MNRIKPQSLRKQFMVGCKKLSDSTALMLLVFLILSCSAQPPLDDLNYIPPTTSADQQFINIFRPLDGDWHGSFYVYTDSVQLDTPYRPKEPEQIAQKISSMTPGLVISVQQRYRSLTPFFQKVHITDRYTDSEGRPQIVQSDGVNKVQEGKLWCVVKKPDETVIHSGNSPRVNALIWQRAESDPQKIEYFYETVSDSVYRILGWGYYSNDDPQKAPRYWFKSNYHKLH